MKYTPQNFISMLTRVGYNFFAGVPCSNQKSILSAIYANKNCDFYFSLNPGIAITLAAGSALAGRLPIVITQNSGIGAMLTSIYMLFPRYKLSGLLLISYRKTPKSFILNEGHRSLNARTLHLLDFLGLQHFLLQQTNYNNLQSFLSTALYGLKCIVIEDNTFPASIIATKVTDKDQAAVIKQQMQKPGVILTKQDCSKTTTNFSETMAVAILADFLQDNHHFAAVITEGQLSRKFFAYRDSPNILPLNCALGYTSSIGLGVALCTDKLIMAVDGDGGLLMNPAILPLVAEQKPKNYVHVLMNNRSYASTGGQAILYNAINWDHVAISFGYAAAITISSEKELIDLLTMIEILPKPIFINLLVNACDVDKPSIMKPTEAVSEDFKNFLQGLR